MNPRKTVLLIAISLLLFSLGCLGSKTAAPTATLPPATSASATATPAKPADTATPTATAKPTQPQTTVELGDLQRNEAGGFAIRAVPGYQLIPFGEMLNMLAPDADPDTGPVVTVIGGTVDETTNQDLYNQLKSGATLQVGPAEPIVVQGLPGLAADLSGENNGKPMRGRAALVMVTPTQQFVLLLGAPITQWDQVSPLFDALLASVEFFAPTVAELPVVEAPTATPAAGFAFPSGRYPYTNPNTARDVLVYDGMVYVATLGGAAVWEVSPTLKDGYATIYTPLHGLSHVSTNALALCDVPVADGSKSIELTTAQGLPTDNIMALLADGETMWIALDVGLARYANNKVELVLDKGSLPHPYLRDLALTPDGQLLIGANLSILRYDGRQVEVLYNLQKAGFKGWLNVLAVAPDRTIWAGTQNGVLYSADGKTWTHLTTADGLLTNFISALHVDPYGGVWIGGGSNTAGGGLLYIVP